MTDESEEMVVAGRRWVKGSRPWKPEVGETLICTFIAKRQASGDHGSTYGVCSFREVSTGRVYTVAGVVITSEVECADLEYGAQVMLVYRGEDTSQAGRTFKKYDLFIDAGDAFNGEQL